jgi:hypothetical protein
MCTQARMKRTRASLGCQAQGVLTLPACARAEAEEAQARSAEADADDAPGGGHAPTLRVLCALDEVRLCCVAAVVCSC